MKPISAYLGDTTIRGPGTIISKALESMEKEDGRDACLIQPPIAPASDPVGGHRNYRVGNSLDTH